MSKVCDMFDVAYVHDLQLELVRVAGYIFIFP